jgi:prepilin-type N-terminal cleavage/methylation domain-containing protein/prepilin-type processing-associated H-X9-DG protein
MIKHKAFTLLELLVVIAIIAMLLAVFIPSLARAKEQGREVYCQSNLRQLHVAAVVYAECQRGYFPIAYYSTKSLAERVSYCWDFTVRNYSDGNRTVETSILWQGDTIEKVQQCPSYKGLSNTTNDPYTGYNYNTSYIGHGQNEMPSQPDRSNQMRRPAYCAIFGDGQTINGANKFMRSPLPSDSDWNFSGRYGGAQGYRHNKSTNVVWCDGHLESRQEYFTGTNADGSKEAIEAYNNENPQCPVGFLSADKIFFSLRV